MSLDAPDQNRPRLGRPESFRSAEQAGQAAYLARIADTALLNPRTPHSLKPEHRRLNLGAHLRDEVEAYFGPPRNIAWHLHAASGMSSQACCINFLTPLATQPALLARVIGRALDIEPPRMLEVESGPGGTPWYVAFEWIGRQDHLSEWPIHSAPSRGANVTSVDAMVRFEHGGITHGLLIEWKYAEAYGNPINPAGNAVRMARYADKVFAPEGPIRAELGLKVEDFFWEPLYQLLRQQMLALRMTRAREDGVDRVRLLHISPAGNTALPRVTSPALHRFGDDVFEVFRGLLKEPSDFIQCSVEDVFAPILAEVHTDPAAGAWAGYLRDRYRFASKV